MQLNQENLKELVTQYFTFRTINHLFTSAFVWIFFPILIYRETNSINAVFTERLIHFAVLGAVFVATSMLLDKLGYLRVYRLSAGALAFALLVALFTLPQIGDSYILVTILLSISNGLFWPVEHAFNTREVHAAQRSRIVSISAALSTVTGVVLPFLAGLAITITGNYEILFMISIFVALTGLVVPFEFNYTQRTSVRSSEMVAIIKNPGFMRYALAQTLIVAGLAVYSALFIIIPFLFLESELNVGIFLAVIGILSAVFSYLKRSSDDRTKVKYGIIGGFLFNLGHILLVIFWSPVMLILQALTKPLNDNTTMVAFHNTDYNIREKMLGKDIIESTVEFTIIVEVIYLIVRVIAFAAIILLVSLLGNQAELAIRLIIPIATITYFLGYLLLITIKPHRQGGS